ncbi:MAG TPA: MFS transporter [Candidatus Bathyarchaeia archaeon]|nr:MFS transporter [Candidatus Bathyarchaeia archaeon]
MANTSSEASGFYASKSAFATLLLVVFLDNLGFAVVLPYLYFYVLALGGSAFLYGVILASYSLMSFIFTPIIARLSDRFGRRKILIIELAVASLSYFVFGLANAVWVLFLGRMLSGTTGATVPVAQAYVADVTSPNRRLKYLGVISAAAGVAFILGPAVGGTLSAFFGYAVPSFLVSALAFSNMVLAYFRLPEPPSFNIKKTVLPFSDLLAVLRKRKIALLLTIYFLFFVAFVFLQAVLSPWLKAVFGFGALQTGLIFFFFGGVSALVQGVFLPALNKRFSQLALVLLSIGVLTVGLVALAAFENLGYVLAVAAFIAFGFGIEYVTLNTLISLNTPKEAQGGALGVAWAIAGLAQTIAPVLATAAFYLGSNLGFVGLVFIISGAISAATIPLVLIFKKAA